MLTTSERNIPELGNEVCGFTPIPASEIHNGNRCKYCGSEEIIKWGKQNGQQKYKCKDCGHHFHLNGKFPRMRRNYNVIATALDMYFEGLSLNKVIRQLRKFFKVYICRATLWSWIQKYTPLVKKFTRSLTPKKDLNVWHADETAIHIKGKGGKGAWYWDIVDRDSRFIVGTHISKNRQIKDAAAVFNDAKEQTKTIPKMVIWDGLPSYYKGLKKVFGGSTVYQKIKVSQKAGIYKKMPYNNNRIERYHNTIKERTKIMRGMQNPLGILDGFTIHYNFMRVHQTLGTTPAIAAGIELSLIDGWGDLIQYATMSKCLKTSHVS